MSWQGQMSTIVRHLINDLDPENYKYTTNRIESSILVSAFLVAREADFSNSYDINVENCGINPDPTESDTKDQDFIILTCLKTACIIIGSELKIEAANAISIKDGPSAIDLRGVASTLSVLYKDLCEKYEAAMMDYRAGGSIAGQAVLGPYSPGSDFVIRTYTDNDLRGGGYFIY
ncbi:hypothetical protein EB118_12705 [bacterium]|nr:hypothetical protein [bacterium]